MMASQEVAIELRGVRKSYAVPWSRRRLVGLEGLDLVVRRGEVVGLLGPNGSGKSTTMKLLLGLLKADAGTVRVLGEEAGSLKCRGRLGYLPESPQFPRFLTGRDLLGYYGGLCGLRGEGLRKRSEEMLGWVGLGAAGDRPLRTYSRGMLQRIGLAQALVHDPEVVILDEPTAGVDPVGAHEFRQLIGELKREGKTVIFSSHLMSEVEAVVDRVVVLHRGRRILEGALGTLLEQEGGWVVECDGVEASAEQRAELEARVREWGEKCGGGRVAVVAKRRTLEEVYRETVARQEVEGVKGGRDE